MFLFLAYPRTQADDIPPRCRTNRSSQSLKVQSRSLAGLQIAAPGKGRPWFTTCRSSALKEWWAMNSRSLKVIMLAWLCGLAACQSPPDHTSPSQNATPATPRNNVDLAVRNNAFALLADLLNDEKNVSKILLIKFESPEVDRLITEISKTADEGATLLETFSKSDPSLAKTNLDLPPGEKATRDAIAQTKKEQLLHTKGKEFEFELLLTQVQALSYGAHLASVIAANEPLPDRARQFTNLSAQLKRLYGEVTALLRTR
jgi:hypothetical protein